MTAIEITLTNMLEFTHSSEHLFKKVILRSNTYFKTGKEREREGGREGERSQKPLVSMLGFLPSYHFHTWSFG